MLQLTNILNTGMLDTDYSICSAIKTDLFCKRHTVWLDINIYAMKPF